MSAGEIIQSQRDRALAQNRNSGGLLGSNSGTASAVEAWISGRNHPIYIVRPARFLGAPAVTGQEDGEYSRAPVVLHDARHRPY